MTDTVRPNKPLTTPKKALYLSFAAIDWQAPWMAHISQLNFLSQTLANLSNRSEHDNLAEQSSDYYSAKNLEMLEVNTQINAKNGFSKSSTIIADLLNTAMCQKAADTQYQPQTKPTLDNQAYTLRFVSQDDLPEGMAYEHFIGTTGQIPTRENLHDLFNGSIWLTFPKTKALLNYHHMFEMATQNRSLINSPKNIRGRVRDTITVFDENGAILATCEPDIGAALIDFNWQASLVTPRDEWDNPKLPNKDAKASVYIFGHALLEQLIQPRKSLCAHSIVINVTSDFFTLTLPERMSYLDNRVADQMHHLLSQLDVTPRQLAPLPILGVPHFWEDNTDTRFYEDKQVFRSGRRRKS